MDYNNGSFGGGGYGRMPQMGMPQMGGQQERMLPMGEMVFVDGVHQLYGMRVMPGAERVFFDKEEDVFFVVCTNHYGQQEIKAFCYEEIQGGAGQEQFVTKQDLEELFEQFLQKQGGGGNAK